MSPNLNGSSKYGCTCVSEKMNRYAALTEGRGDPKDNAPFYLHKRSTDVARETFPDFPPSCKTPSSTKSLFLNKRFPGSIVVVRPALIHDQISLISGRRSSAERQPLLLLRSTSFQVNSSFQSDSSRRYRMYTCSTSPRENGSPSAR